MNILSDGDLWFLAIYGSLKDEEANVLLMM